MRRVPQWRRVLEILEDEEWHSTLELQNAGGGLRVPARVDDLRRRGHVIACRRSGRGPEPVWLYRLLSSPTPRDRVDVTPAPPRGEPSASPRPIDDCAGCGGRAELVDVDALYCGSCAGAVNTTADILDRDEPLAHADGQLVFGNRAMRRQEAE